MVLQIHTQKELGSLLSLSSRFPAFTSTQLLVAKLSALLLSVSPAKHLVKDPDCLFQEPVWHHAPTVHWRLLYSAFGVLQSFRKHNHFRLISLPWNIPLKSWTILSSLVTPCGILLKSQIERASRCLAFVFLQHQCLSSLKTSRPQWGATSVASLV